MIFPGSMHHIGRYRAESTPMGVTGSHVTRQTPVWRARALAVLAAAAFLVSACGGDGVDLEGGGSGEPVVLPTAAESPPPVDPPPPVAIPEDLSLQLTPVLEIEQPIAMGVHPVTGATFVATKTGIVAEVDLATGAIVEEVIDIGGGLAGDFVEQGLLGLAFSPDGEYLYLDFTDSDYSTVVAEYPASGGVIDASAGRSVLRVAQPESNHNGGHLAFGPDGYLYVALGDGGGSGDQYGNGQNTETLLATILRIDPRATGEAAYAVPGDNPFVVRGGRAEIFLYGVRNPWRFSFDRLTGDLWIADVGQDALEEVNVLPAAQGWGRGANLGWPLVEGTAPFAASGPPGEGYVAPIYEYGRADGCSITGGYVYRGQAIPELSGIYVFGDFCTSELWGLAASPEQGSLGRFDLGLELAESSLVSFFEDLDGELYVLSFEGVIYRLEPSD